ncbi:2-keto-4-pentenoate hydratase [Azospirillum thiophilum]|uniref:2-keto-4-pentenoate hydratase n=1 Tax=Azospirillum thiophilum TaxID=528244 RepID=A0AAC8W524_9PROT|nr:fumarylacetoacetate hydrolase family protein [Azospirillum thiophilum]ALG75238.1 2-keto-4-pentenoate hydratase [Azospirillum thiophilum]KJR62631.1 2-keto-4-pentenoate hydratase [Azospirillum thiophilum]
MTDTVESLIAARETRQWLTGLTTPPADKAEAYAVQDAVARRLGPVTAWKVGAPAPDAEPFRAPINAATVFDGADRLPAKLFQVIGVEAEIAYRFDRDLPAREQPYTREEVLDAVASVHPAWEIVDTRFTGFGSQDGLSHMADQFNHGALVVGPAIADWRSLDPLKESVTLEVNGETKVETVGGNSAGDPVRLLVWMANVGARSFDGLHAGDVVTTGSCTGTVFVEPGSRSVARYGTMGTIELTVD